MYKYIIISSIILGSYAIIYSIFLRKETFFRYNRIYLLASITLGLIIPILPQVVITPTSPLPNLISQLTIKLPDLIFSNRQPNTIEESNLNYNNVLLALYLSGVLYFGIKLIISIITIKTYYNTGQIIHNKNYSIILLDKPIIAFSFFNYIFVNTKTYNSINKDEIITHELVHINQHHSYDILLVEILKVIFWFNPIFILYKKFISEVHEYLADDKVIQNIPRKTYSELLINQLQSGVQYNIANYFINSLIKNRIKMMYKTKTNNRWKYLLAIPMILLLAFFINACNKNTDIQQHDTTQVAPVPPPPPPPPTPSELQHKKQKTIYTLVEQMPRFFGCEEMATKKEKEECAYNKLYEYIYSNLKYPVEAHENGISGKVYLKFVIDKNGDVSNVTILKDIGGGCGEAVKKVIEGMSKLPQKWIPGQQDGKKVDVWFTLPVVFRLDDNNK